MNFLFDELERTFYLFAFEVGQASPSILTDAYKTDVGKLFRNIENARFTNANMRNIASTAVTAAMSNSSNIFVNLVHNSRILKICIPTRSALVTELNFTQSNSSDFNAVSEELRINSNFFRYVFVVPDLDSLHTGIQQTPFLTNTKEEEFKQNNMVN